MTRKVLILLTLLPCWQLRAQISHGGTPLSFLHAISSVPPTAEMSAVDRQLLLDEDRAEAEAALHAQLPIAPRIAYGHEANLNLNNSGSWETLGNGDRTWRLRIESRGANAIMLVFDRWILSDGAMLFLYDDARGDIRGAFTSENNWIDGTNITAPIPGEAVTLELNVPSWQELVGELSIQRVGHVYRGFTNRNRPLDDFSDAQACEFNINCPEGAEWQDEKRGVALIISSEFRICSGSLIRNACEPLDPLFLTAEHCTEPAPDFNNNPANWVFIFNYEAPDCPHPFNEPSTSQSVANCTPLASWGLDSGGDFALMRLSELPPVNYNVYINGWNRREVVQNSSAGIHHPKADIKKISIDSDPFVSDDWYPTFPNSHWKVIWDLGTTEPGSSGSPLFGPNGRIVGDLTGGYFLSDCDDHNSSFNYSKYSKLSNCWSGGGSAGTRLSDYLDPCGSGIEVLDGIEPNALTIFVDHNAAPGGNGSSGSPFRTVQQGVNAVQTGGLVVVRDGSYPPAITISRAMIIQSQNGTATIGN